MAEDGNDQLPIVSEIADLLDQCSPEELNNILEAIESGDGCAVESFVSGNGCVAPQSPVMNNEPVPPPGPPPSNGNGRRPVPAGIKRSASGGEVTPAEAIVSVGEMKKLLEEHSVGVLDEVRKIVNFPVDKATPASAVTTAKAVATEDALVQAALVQGTLSLDVLTQVLAQRDQEVKGLEANLSELQDLLFTKDRRIMSLNSELDAVIREVRHRQLDLEFQQLKLEERVRSNNELEQAQRTLTARAEDANRDARHAALDIDLGRSMPRSARSVQGSLSWMLRKNRPWGTGDAWASP